MAKKLTDKGFVTSLSDTNSLFGNFGGVVGQITIENLRKGLNQNDEEVLNNLAFYIDVNKPSSLGSTRVDVGGNMGMRQLWEDAAVSVIMDANGNYCELNRDDCRYTAEGDSVLNADGTVIADFDHGDFMKIIPATYGRVQQVTVGSTTIQRLWLSLVPLPGGYIIPQQVVSKFKCTTVGNKLRSLPGVIPAVSKTINEFFNLAQARSKNHGLANLDFHNHLLFYMMSKYAYRDCQNCKGSDGTLVWGVGLDGTESTGTNKFVYQKNIKTGHTLSLGDYDGKAAVKDNNNTTVHGVTVAGFENPWGQYWEMMQGLCSVGTDVFCWRHNWLPTGTSTAATFSNVEHVKLTRPTTTVWGMNIISSEKGQGVYMIPKVSLSGVYYGDSFSYNADGQLWLRGGGSVVGASCGLAFTSSFHAWSYAAASLSARLAMYGEINRVTSDRFAELKV